ncbi:MCE family protein [Nocardia otitidiscaviarum]|uniref:MCE family protein n=1 Tax=Nocardia otitidiscaviarum TaxID=1823 RepID=UPI002457574E|nr:MCE family protein [Nocardia otitidiscaviarum]
MNWGRTALVAGAAAVAVATGVAGVTWVNSVRADSTQRVCADFTDTVGLYEGNSVTMLGVEVGTVSTIESRGDHMRVTMTVDGDVRLPVDIQAVTMSSSIVTDRHVELTKPHTGGPEFDTASCIPLERTKTPVGISEALDAMGRIAGDLTGGGSPEDTLIDQTLTAADGALADTGQQWNLLLRELSQVVGDPGQRDVVFRRLVENLDTLTTMFVSNWPDMALLLDNLRQGIQLLGEFSAEFAGAVDLAVEFLPVIARNVGKYDEQMYALLDQYLPQVKQLINSQGDIGDLLANLPPLAARLPQAGAR